MVVCDVAAKIEGTAISSYQGRTANDVMEALLLITLLMIAVDGPVTPSEISQDTKDGIMAAEPTMTPSAWTGGPEVNMWTAGEGQQEDQ